MAEPKLISCLFKFDSRYYEKYDRFTLNGVEFMCLDRPFQLDGFWYVRALPAKDTEVKFVGNAVSEILNGYIDNGNNQD